MSKFDFMAFGYSAGGSDMFVTHAKKYTAEETVALCKTEYDCKFTGHRQYGCDISPLRDPTIADIHLAYCAFRFGVSPEWPDGCYTFVNECATGSFPVNVIIFSELITQEAQ